MFMKLNFIERLKEKEFKGKRNKQNKQESKKCYSCEKKRHFARDYRLINVMNRRKLNVLQKMVMRERQSKEFESESKFSRVITNDEYYRIKNIDELQQILNEIASSKALVNTKEVNESIRLISQRKSNTLYSFREEKLKYNQEFETRLQKIIDALKEMLSNDATKEKDILEKNINQARRAKIEEKKNVEKQCTTSC